MAIIECKIGPETPTVDGVEYQFQRDQRGRFVALVTDHEHQKILLGNPVYRVIDDDETVDHVDTTPEPDTSGDFKGETDAQVAERLQREAEEEVSRRALAEQEAAQQAETDEINNANAEDRAPNLTIDPHTSSQLPSVDPTRPEDDQNGHSPLSGAIVAPALEEVAADDGVEEVEVDDFTLIKGIGPHMQDLLYEHGVYTYEDMAKLTDEQIDALDTALSAKGSIMKNDWRGNAAQLVQNLTSDEG